MKGKNGTVKPLNLIFGTVGVLFIVVILGFILDSTGVIKLSPQTVAPAGTVQGSSQQPNSGAPNTPGSATTISVAGVDAQTNAVVGTTSYIGISNQGLTTGVTTSAPAVSANILLVNSTGSYHSAFLADVIPSYAYSKNIPMAKNASVTLAVYNTAKGAMTNGGGATNQSVSTGSNPTMELDITGSALASTQDMVCVLEGSDTSKINKLVLNGFGATLLGTSKPSSYTLNATTSGVWVYSVPAVTDASLRVGSIYAESKTGQSMAGKMFKINCQTSENFIDSSATSSTVNTYAKLIAQPNVYYGIEDSTGTSKSIASYSFVGFFT